MSHHRYFTLKKKRATDSLNSIGLQGGSIGYSASYKGRTIKMVDGAASNRHFAVVSEVSRVIVRLQCQSIISVISVKNIASGKFD